MVKESDYMAVVDKNKRISEFGKRKTLAWNAKVDFKHGDTGFYKSPRTWSPTEFTYALSMLDESLKQESFNTADKYFNSIKDRLDKGEGLSKDEIGKYENALAKRGYRLVDRLNKKHIYDSETEKILKYCEKHLENKSSGLEKTLTVISSLIIITGIAIGYPVLTGNVIAENLKVLSVSGALLFILGLLGVFIANKK